MTRAAPSKLSLLAALLATLAVVVHAPTWSYGFTHLDDHELVVAARAIPPSPSGLSSAFNQSYFGGRSTSYYRPIVSLSLAADTRYSGPNAWGYHLSNTLLHAAVTLLLFALARRLGFRATEAFIAAGLFAVHPVNVAAVAWIPGRNDLLMVGFALAACWFLLAPRARWGRPGLPILLHSICWLGALLSKESALGLPVVFVALLLHSQEPRPSPRRPALWLSWAAVLALYFGLRTHAGASWDLDLPVRLGVALGGWRALVSGLGKLCCPVGLQVLATPGDSNVWPALPAFVVAAALVGGVSAQRKAVRLALIFTLPALLTSLLGGEHVVLESRLYWAAVGPCLLAGKALGLASTGRPLGLWIRRGLAAAAVLGLGALSQRHAQRYRDRDAFARAAIVASPHSGLAVHLLRRSAASHGARGEPPAAPGLVLEQTAEHPR